MTHATHSFEIELTPRAKLDRAIRDYCEARTENGFVPQSELDAEVSELCAAGDRIRHMVASIKLTRDPSYAQHTDHFSEVVVDALSHLFDTSDAETVVRCAALYDPSKATRDRLKSSPFREMSEAFRGAPTHQIEAALAVKGV